MTINTQDVTLVKIEKNVMKIKMLLVQKDVKNHKIVLMVDIVLI